MNEGKTCANCAAWMVEPNDFPCANCHDRELWVERVEEELILPDLDEGLDEIVQLAMEALSKYSIDGEKEEVVNEAVEEEVKETTSQDCGDDTPCGDQIDLSPFCTQVGGNHYASDDTIELAEWLIRNRVESAEANVMKYAFRHEKKNGIEDIKKAQQYLKFIAWVKYNEVI